MLCSIVVPVYNEERNIPELYDRLLKTFSSIKVEFEIIFVDDGSKDNSLEKIKPISSTDKRVFYLSFTRNFGHEAASTAGLDASRGDCVILMDADLQDPPEIIQEMIDLWRKGYYQVLAKRRKRYGESAFKQFTAKIFYRMINLLSDIRIPIDTGDFRLMDRAVVNDFLKCREQNRFTRGLTAWVGYNSVTVEFDRPERFAGETKYNKFKLLLLSLDVITGFSILPLRIVTIVGFGIAMVSLVLTFVIVLQKLFFHLNIAGYALLASGLFFMTGIQIFFFGVIGEYVGKIFRQVQQRPLYLVKDQNLPR